MREEKPESKKPEVRMAPTNPYPNSQLETVMVTKEMQTGGWGLGRFTCVDPTELNEPLQSHVFLKVLESSFEHLFPQWKSESKE